MVAQMLQNSRNWKHSHSRMFSFTFKIFSIQIQQNHSHLKKISFTFNKIIHVQE